MSRLTALLFLLGTAHALPIYGARGARTCDNCHSAPNLWYDPPEVADRKCTLSCAGCHVDPTGGALRNVSGRYFGRNVLPTWGADHRPLDDHERHLAWIAGEVPADVPTSGPTIPDSEQRDPRGPTAPPTSAGPAWGKPYKAQSSIMSWLEGRYEDEIADPLLLLGGDARVGYWSQGPLFFPMQADLYAALQPVEHLTGYVAAGARGRARSLTLDSDGADEQDRFGVRDLWLMTHEWPYLAYARVGRFLPPFGTRIADHTAPIRRGFGLSQEDPANRVVGAEVGFTANYPYLHLAAFKPSTKKARNPFGVDPGWGTALSVGWRDLGWQLGGSAMYRDRPLDGGGRTLEFSLQAAWNPWRHWKAFPVTWLGEAVWGGYERELSGSTTGRVATYQQLAYAFLNGFVARLPHDFWDPDTMVKEDHISRYGLGLDWTLVPGLTIGVDGRVAQPAEGETGADLFAQIHGWF